MAFAVRWWTDRLRSCTRAVESSGRAASGRYERHSCLSIGAHAGGLVIESPRPPPARPLGHANGLRVFAVPLIDRQECPSYFQTGRLRRRPHSMAFAARWRTDRLRSYAPVVESSGRAASGRYDRHSCLSIGAHAGGLVIESSRPPPARPLGHANGLRLFAVPLIDRQECPSYFQTGRLRGRSYAMVIAVRRCTGGLSPRPSYG